MAAISTINVRMPEPLKRHGSQVLERDGISPSELVRSAYRYLEREQRIPDCLDIAGNEEDVFSRRRKLARSLYGKIHLQEPLDSHALRMGRVESKYGELL